jgi:hypothetical protein
MLSTVHASAQKALPFASWTQQSEAVEQDVEPAQPW